jgi:hypothetical protein
MPHIDPLTTLFAAFERYDSACGLPPDARRRADFERFIHQLYRLDATASEEISRRESQFLSYRYRGAELDELTRVLAAGERIVSVTPVAVTTDRRELTRAQLRRPRWATETQAAYEAWCAISLPSPAELHDLNERYKADVAAAEARARQQDHSAELTEITAGLLAASRQRAVEAQEDAIAAMVQRSNARRGVNS